MKTKNISESLGYITAINDVIVAIKEMTESKPERRMIDSIELVDRIVSKQDLSISPVDGDYTIDMVDSKHPHKNIAGEDALLSLNPVFQLNKKTDEKED